MWLFNVDYVGKSVPFPPQSTQKTAISDGKVADIRGMYAGDTSTIPHWLMYHVTQEKARNLHEHLGREHGGGSNEESFRYSDVR